MPERLHEQASVKPSYIGWDVELIGDVVPGLIFPSLDEVLRDPLSVPAPYWSCHHSSFSRARCLYPRDLDLI